MNDLMIHTPGAKRGATLDDLAAVPLPAVTKTYCPVAHVDLVSEVRRVFDALCAGDPVSERFGLAREGQHMFGTVTYDMGTDVAGLTAGFRNSYNKTLSVGIVSGAGVFVCDNLMFHGELKVVRCHTTQVWADLPRMIQEMADKAIPEYNRLEDTRVRMQEVELGDDDAFSLLGIARGRDILPPRVFERSLKEWVEPTTLEFREERNVWGLYQGVTEALKGQPPRDLVQRHNAAHRFFAEAA